MIYYILIKKNMKLKENFRTTPIFVLNNSLKNWRSDKRIMDEFIPIIV